MAAPSYGNFRVRAAQDHGEQDQGDYKAGMSIEQAHAIRLHKIMKIRDPPVSRSAHSGTLSGCVGALISHLPFAMLQLQPLWRRLPACRIGQACPR